jgi:hypothetical protein
VSENDVVVVAERCTPFLKTLYPTTPTSSVDAVQVRLICDDEATLAARLLGVDGGVVSGDGGGSEPPEAIG